MATFTVANTFYFINFQQSHTCVALHCNSNARVHTPITADMRRIAISKIYIKIMAVLWITSDIKLLCSHSPHYYCLQYKRDVQGSKILFHSFNRFNVAMICD